VSRPTAGVSGQECPQSDTLAAQVNSPARIALK
jgi:hypothetical protein